MRAPRLTSPGLTFPKITLTAPTLDHLVSLTDEVGLFEHARGSEPRREHGYCVDDVARGLLLCAREPETTPMVSTLTERYLQFLESAIAPDGRSHNRRAADGAWTDEPGDGDWWGRSIWGLGVAACMASSTLTRSRARQAVVRLVMIRSPHPRAMTFAALGVGELVLAGDRDPTFLSMLRDGLAVIPDTLPGWDWPEPRLRYSNASLAEALRLWQGLGYPRRARNLHLTAALVGERHDGALPDDLDALLALPGIGPYTARAVLAFAFERDVAVVDTNIARVLARSVGDRLTPKRAQSIADAAVPVGDGWIWNQVLMDLGATVCRPTPRCGDCPLAASCRWHLGGHPEPDPAVGSAGVSTRQAPFEGSDRQARGRVMAALHSGPRPTVEFDHRILATLVSDGLVEIYAESARLAN